MRQQLASGINPAEERWKQKRMGSFSRRAIVLRSFEQAARAWIETRRPGWSKRYEAFITGRLEADIFPIVGKQDISRITMEDIRNAFRNIQARGAMETDNRLRPHCSEILRFSLPDGYSQLVSSRDSYPP